MKNLIKGLKTGQKAFGEDIAIIVNSALLTLVYVIGIGATFIFSKLFGKKFLDIELNASPSYWEDLNLTKKPIGAYYRQF